MGRYLLLFCCLLNLFSADELDIYFNEAGTYYDINPKILSAIAQTESKKNPDALNCANRNGSCDFGIMQINSIHLPLLATKGISKHDLFNPKINIYIGAWVLKNCIQKYGTNYKALNCYNGKIKNNSYYMKVIKNYYTLPKTKTVVENANKYKILIIGDSMAQGLYPQFKRILKKHDVEVVTKYKVGSSSNYWASQNISRIIEDEKPHFVFVALGTNEINNPYVEDTVKIIDSLNDTGIDYRWILPIIPNSDVYNRMIKEQLGDFRAIYSEENYNLYDGVHPTLKGFKNLSYYVLKQVFGEKESEQSPES